MKPVLLLVAVICWLNFSTVHAQSVESDVRVLEEAIPDTLADQLLTLVTNNLARARGNDGKPLPPLTEAQRARPLFDREFVKEIFDVGVASGVGEACRLDWQNGNYLPLMKRVRARGDLSSHQLAAVSMLHGLGQEYASKEPCTPGDKENVSKFYRKKWTS